MIPTGACRLSGFTAGFAKGTEFQALALAMHFEYLRPENITDSLKPLATQLARRCTVAHGSARLAATFYLLLLVGSTASAQNGVARKSSIDELLDALAATRAFREVAVSPDGKSVAWVEAKATGADAPAHSAMYVMELESTAAPRRITPVDGTRAQHGLAWSPDGKQLVFLSTIEKSGQVQLYVAPVTGKTVRRLTDLHGVLAHPQWSPDGKHIALLHTEGTSQPTGPTQPAAPELGEVGQDTRAQRLTIMDAESGRVRTTSPANLHIHEYDWSPDSKQLAAVASPPPGDRNWYVARLYALSAATGEVREILKPATQIAVPRWSPDGKSIAYISGLMSDEGANGGDIYTVPVAGGEPRNRTPALKASASWLAWSPSSDRIGFAEHVDGGTGIATLDLNSDKVASLWTGPETFSAGGWSPAVSLAQDGNCSALIRHSFHQPPEVWAGPIGAWKQVTHANQDAKAAWGEAKSLHWKSDTWDVQGWLLYPRDFDAKKRYPLVVSVHGGPASSRHPAWPGVFFDLAVLAHEGCFVFFPNPRGSFGQGEQFTRANVKDFGHGDLSDILSGVDAVLKTAPVDPARLGIAGWSYGGYMTMWAVTQTTRFRSAVAGAGIANWQSYYGQNGIDQWLLPYFGATVYDDPAVYARSS